jgi:lipopolysaccharide transport system ATP-binding protein
VEEARQGVYKSTCHVPGDLLNNGKYTVDLYFMRDGSFVIYKMENPVVFEIHDTEREPGSFLGELPGVVRPNLRWDTERLR